MATFRTQKHLRSELSETEGACPLAIRCVQIAWLCFDILGLVGWDGVWICSVANNFPDGNVLISEANCCFLGQDVLEVFKSLSFPFRWMEVLYALGWRRKRWGGNSSRLSSCRYYIQVFTMNVWFSLEEYLFPNLPNASRGSLHMDFNC